MSRNLILHIRFLDGRFHGRVERGRAEDWPPSPLRLFQALLAGAAPRWFDADVERRERAALAWLEAQSPPTITTPAWQLGPPLLTYVPNNNRGNADRPLDKVRTAKTVEPVIFGADRVIEYRYALAPADAAVDVEAAGHARVICDIARHVRCLGWGIDMAVGSGEIVGDDAPTNTTPAKLAETTIAAADTVPNGGRITSTAPSRTASPARTCVACRRPARWGRSKRCMPAN